MAISNWSDQILLAELENEPSFSEDLDTLALGVADQRCHVVLNMSKVTQLNSSNLAQLLRLRKNLIEADLKLRLCSMPDSIWSIILVTGLDKVFQFSEDVPSALTGLQIEN